MLNGKKSFFLGERYFPLSLCQGVKLQFICCTGERKVEGRERKEEGGEGEENKQGINSEKLWS